MFKTVTIKPDLTFSVEVANILVEMNSLSWNLPRSVSTVDEFATLLNAVAGSRICCGCYSEEYSCLKTKALEVDARFPGTARKFSTKDHACSHSDAKTVYFSATCLGFLPRSSLGQCCSQCSNLGHVLRNRLYRMQQSAANSLRTTNWCNLSQEEQKQRYYDQQRRRINAEKRERYNKERLSIERSSRKLVERDHRELKEMMKQIEQNQATTSKGDGDLFRDEPSMNMFWKVQKDMVDKGQRLWHPR